MRLFCAVFLLMGWSWLIQSSCLGAVTWQTMVAPAGFFNADIIYENDGTPEANGTIGSRYFYENGLQSGTPLGLNPSGTYLHNFESYLGIGGNAQFQLGSYQQNQVRKTNSASAVSVFDVVDGSYDYLAFVAAVGNNSFGLMLNYTVTYADASTLSASVHVLDWGVTPPVGSPNELFNVGRSAVYTGGLFSPEGAGQNWSAFAYLIPVDSTKVVTSFSYTSSAVGENPASGDMVFFAMSAGVVPEPQRLLLLMIAAGMLLLNRQRRKDFVHGSTNL